MTHEQPVTITTALCRGKTWSEATDTTLGGLGAKEYSDRTTALKKCAASSSCKGVVKKKNGKYVTASKKSKKTKS